MPCISVYQYCPSDPAPCGVFLRQSLFRLRSQICNEARDYADNDIDLVLSGHAHGGQFRLPFVGGLAAPNQGLFPAYDAGVYTQAHTNMVVSRGIGNSVIPFRIHNRPEVIRIQLQRENESLAIFGQRSIRK